MSNNSSEFPQLGPIIILLLIVVEDHIVGENFLILVIIDGATMELELFSIIVELSILFLNDLDNVSVKPLTIFLGIKEEGTPNKV